ncbi:ABC transporter ATP-binding protein [Roseicyclus sp. F158]|uniref:ABC transporter ATP-binding protein n=1 Tax=Tropicimonas omnivorans TaxID=3075590 RepID=A0ABU3DL97_9RHOB|nr:ABC transporter ATP-binding protein [Roseicyclus sp. F158]MDT0684481.1 ABC transporter ATP-binding protein [Roseicyclus sp. F158]
MTGTLTLDGSATGAPVPAVSGTPPAEAGAPALVVEDLSVRRGSVHLVESTSLSVAKGETLCLVGESGCGKSLTCTAMMGLTNAPLAAEGSIRVLGREISGLPERRLNGVRGRDVAMIFQDPMAALNPIQRVGAQVAEILSVHGEASRTERRREVLALFERVGLPDPERQARAYPHQLSGGMCQRVMIAMAIACRPRILIADEPTTALDVTIQAQILRLLRELQDETGMAMIFVTHDLGVVAEIADRVAVMYSGRVVEEAGVDEIFDAPRHPYTRALMACRVGTGQPGEVLPAITGSVPAPSARPAGCVFAPRCDHAGPPCLVRPRLKARMSGARVACHLGEGAA